MVMAAPPLLSVALLVAAPGCSGKAALPEAEPLSVSAPSELSASPGAPTIEPPAPLPAAKPAPAELVVIASGDAAKAKTTIEKGDLDDSGVVVTVGDDDKTGSRSVGHPRKGRIINAVQLKPAKGIRIRYPDRAWATEDTIFDLLDAIDAVRRQHPKAPAVLIGDLSLPKGGSMPPHHSHQTGRDVDVGLFFTDAPPEGLDNFRPFDGKNFDAAKTWALLQAFVGPDLNKPRVKEVFFSWEAQEALLAHASKQGVPKATLDRIFQVSSRSKDALVRHVEGHRGHMHVRFRCPKGRIRCTDLAPESVAYQKVRRKCVKRKKRAAKRRKSGGSKLQQLLAGGGGGGKKAKGVLGRLDKGVEEGDPDVHCFIVELE